VDAAHRQGEYRVRFDWGRDGAAALVGGADVAVVVDVLSFTTTLSVAADRGIAVLPYRWRDDTADAFARDYDAVLAVGRSQAIDGGISLSPVSVRAERDPPARLVLPSPNGSSIAHLLADSGVTCIGACLRNAGAVAAWLTEHAGGTEVVAVVAAGEHWPSGALRPAVEDAWGAGAVISDLRRRGWTGLAPEAEFAAAAYGQIRGRELPALLDCASGRELTEYGFRADAEIAAELDQSMSVPVLRDEQFVTG
jgi:2-phosphosulfolactate phosphatase